MTTEHSPLPWRSLTSGSGSVADVIGASGVLVATFVDPSDAAIIVEACNSYHALREENARLREAIVAIAKAAEGGHSYEVTLTNMLLAASAALGKP